MIKLSERLKTVAGFIKNGASVADIGTDHGHLPVYLAQNGLASRIIASDISSGSLKAAIRSAEKYGVADKISFINAPGLAGVSETDADTIVIAGMGGETIAGILEGATWTKCAGVRLILQPQTKITVLILRLQENGYVISEIKQVHDHGRLYTIIVASGMVL